MAGDLDGLLDGDGLANTLDNDIDVADALLLQAGSGTGLATIASIKTLDMGIMGALIISGIATMLHNKFFDTELPEWLGVFSGSVFIYMIGFFVMVPVALIACLVWPHVQAAISAF